MSNPNLNSNNEKTKIIKNRPKVYKLKHELDDYYFLCMAHKEILTIFYDYYSECDPEFVKKAFSILFPINRLIKQLLVYCLVYHSIWWGAHNSYLNNLALNFDNINSFLFFTIFYYNFYELIIRSFFMRHICFNILRHFNFFTMQQLKSFLNYAELFIYLLINMKIYFTLKFEQKLANNFICFLMLPHFYFLFYNTFDFKLVIFNYTVFSNKVEKFKQATPNLAHCVSLPNEALSSPFSLLKNANDTPKNTAIVKNQIYTDESNMSLDSFLNGKISIQNLVSSNSNIANNYKELNHHQINLNIQQSSSITNQTCALQPNQTIKLIRQSQNRTKQAKNKLFIWYLNVCNFPTRLINRLIEAFNTWLTMWILIGQYCIEILSSFIKTSKFSVTKRNMFSFGNFSSRFNNLQHKCSNDANQIRDETEYFKLEYNNRLREVLNRTFESVYFNFFITRFLIPSHLNIRDFDFFVYFLSSLLSTFVSYWLYCLPLSFIVSFNRNTEHLGTWRLYKENDKGNSKIKYNILECEVSKWSNTKVYFQGNRVFDNMANIYIAETNYCTSIPGNKIFNNIYRIFSKPFRITYILLSLEVLNIILLLVYFLMNKRWYAITALIMETLFNCHLFFILCRDFFLLKNENGLNLKKN
jgi:hypothetical protein